jgi:hypothetical protein
VAGHYTFSTLLHDDSVVQLLVRGLVSSSARAWILAIAETVALAIFFYCAVVARDMYIEMAAIEFNVPEDLSLSFVEWHTYAREAVWAVVALWFVSIALAASQRFRARNSSSESLRPTGPLLFALGLPVAGALGGFIFDLFLPGL